MANTDTKHTMSDEPVMEIEQHFVRRRIVDDARDHGKDDRTDQRQRGVEQDGDQHAAEGNGSKIGHVLKILPLPEGDDPHHDHIDDIDEQQHEQLRVVASYVQVAAINVPV